MIRLRQEASPDTGPADECSAVSRRFSPDMNLGWLPTVDGKVITGGVIPFSGFDTRAEAVEAARQHVASTNTLPPVSLERQMTAERDAKEATTDAATIIPGWTQTPAGFVLDTGQTTIAITDQSNRGCGWCWHVSIDHEYGHDPIASAAGLATADTAKDAALAWARAYWTAQLTSVTPPPPEPVMTSETFDATREPLRAIRDLISMCEAYRDIDPQDNATIERAQEAFTALRRLFGDNRPNEAVSMECPVEPAVASVPVLLKALQLTAGALQCVAPLLPKGERHVVVFTGKWDRFGRQSVGGILACANIALPEVI